MQAEKINRDIIDAVVSLWIISEEELNFSCLHQGLVKKGIVQNLEYRYKTDRILKKLDKMNLIKKVGRGRYRLNVEPDEFRVFNYLQTLRQRRKTAKLRVGGSLWTRCQLYLIGLPESALEYPIVKSALDVLTVRLSCLFEALRILAQEVEKRERISTKKQPPSLPLSLIRELLLELIPYYLGSFAGLDGDGLPLEELSLVLPRMIQALPEEASYQSPTHKETMSKHSDLINELMKLQSNKVEELEDFQESLGTRPQDFALIVIPPEYTVDEKGYEKRSVKETLADHREKSGIYIASCLLSYDKENVLSVLDVFGQKILGKVKSRQTRSLYEKIYASNHVARIIGSFDAYDRKMKAEALTYIEELTEKNGFKSIIFYLPFSLTSLNFILPTPRKERILRRFFPKHSVETIHKWLNEGAALAREVGDEKLTDVEEQLRQLSEGSTRRNRLG